ncbi:GNAT family N-acetyltransferase [Microbacterium sulfonylureivorans]|uniref:GNAT family N-acetyltransferase n=1 Tax=Microbacterium sulfonylureivorans TaxID=2486854 RepID=UPI000FDA6D67|nr:GNAT family N-acetyltransferase [Microbacterium sulfonylureivorans]
MYMETKKTRLLMIVASTRPGRKGGAVADWFLEATRVRAEELGVSLTVADLAEINLPFLDEPDEPATGRYIHAHTRRWSKLVDGADAFVVCIPEYNHSLPATLKNAMDALSQEWRAKPIAFVSYGNTSAGTRAALAAKSVATTLGMVPITSTVAIRLSDAFVGEELVADARRDAAARHVIDQLHRYAAALAPLRRADELPIEEPGLHGLTLSRADERDASELLVLQRACWVAEAIANDTLDIHALHEPLETIVRGIREYTTWVVRDGARLVGSARARAVGDAWQIGRLMVAPDLRGRGLGRFLLEWVERNAPDEARRFELSTGARSSRNLLTYTRAGYEVQATSHGATHLAKRAGAMQSVVAA